MPFTFVIDKHLNAIRETWTGNVTLQDLKESSQEEWSHPDYQKHLHMICDFRQATVSMSMGEVWTFVNWFGQNESLSKHAIVVTREVGYGLARMFSSISEGTKQHSDSLRIFQSYEEAEKWIGEPIPEKK